MHAQLDQTLSQEWFLLNYRRTEVKSEPSKAVLKSKYTWRNNVHIPYEFRNIYKHVQSPNFTFCLKRYTNLQHLFSSFARVSTFIAFSLYLNHFQLTSYQYTSDKINGNIL